MLTLALLLAAPAGADPGAATSKGSIPASDFITSLAGGLGWLAFIAAIAGIFISAGIWAIGAHSQNFSQTYNGKKGLLVSVLAAVFVGGGSALIGKFYDIGAASVK